MLEQETLPQQPGGIVLHPAQRLLHRLRLFGIGVLGWIRSCLAGGGLSLMVTQQVGQTGRLSRSLPGRSRFALVTRRQGLL